MPTVEVKLAVGWTKRQIQKANFSASDKAVRQFVHTLVNFLLILRQQIFSTFWFFHNFASFSVKRSVYMAAAMHQLSFLLVTHCHLNANQRSQSYITTGNTAFTTAVSTVYSMTSKNIRHNFPVHELVYLLKRSVHIKTQINVNI